MDISRKISLNSKTLAKKFYPLILKKSEEIAPRNIFGKIVLNSKISAKNFRSLILKKSEEIEKEV